MPKMLQYSADAKRSAEYWQKKYATRIFTVYALKHITKMIFAEAKRKRQARACSRPKGA